MAGGAKIFSLRYVGSRFNGARLPVDVLSDLPAFRDLIVAFAKDQWHSRHADRMRVPKGFDKSLAFDLITIEDGSAVPQLEWNRQTAQANLPGFTDELEQIVEAAYQDVVGLIEGGGTVSLLTSEKVRALNRFGAGLRDNERIEIPDRSAKGGKVVCLDSYRRKQLITGARETYQTRFEGIGELVQNNVDGFVTVRTVQHGDIQVPVDTEQIIEEFDGNLQQDVQFELLVELDNHDNLRRVVMVFDIGVIDAELGAELVQCRNRLTEIRSLGDGWHSGVGAAVSTSAVSAADKFLLKRPALSRAYRIFPTEAGGVLIEFESHGWDYSIGFDPRGAVEMYGVAIQDTGEMEPVHFLEVGPEFLDEFDRRVGADE